MERCVKERYWSDPAREATYLKWSGCRNATRCVPFSDMSLAGHGQGEGGRPLCLTPVDGVCAGLASAAAAEGALAACGPRPPCGAASYLVEVAQEPQVDALSRLASVRVRLATTDVVETVEGPAFGAGAALASVGGSAGLLVGFSIRGAAGWAAAVIAKAGKRPKICDA